MSRMILSLILAFACSPFVFAHFPHFWFARKDEAKRAYKGTVPLGNAYSTSGQSEFKAVHRSFSKATEMLVDHSLRNGASNVFLVCAGSVEAAMEGTVEVFCRHIGADRPVNWYPPSDVKDYWVVAYFGTAGTGPGWTVRWVEVKENRLRIAYEFKRTRANDIWPYFFWIPIGQLEPGAYQIELFDWNEGEVALSRRVTIPHMKRAPKSE